MSNTIGDIKDFADFIENEATPIPSFSPVIDELISDIKRITGNIEFVVFVGPPTGEAQMTEDRRLNWSSSMVYSSRRDYEEIASKVKTIRLNLPFALSQQLLRFMADEESHEVASKLILQATKQSVSVDLVLDEDLKEQSPSVEEPRFVIVSFEGGVSSFFLPTSK